MAKSAFFKMTTTSTTGRLGPKLKTRPKVKRVEAGASEGVRLIVDQMQSFVPAFENLIDSELENAGRNGVDLVMRRAPVAPKHGGTLRNSARYERPTRMSLKLIVGNPANARYAYFVEMGFRHWISGRRVPAQPFFFYSGRDMAWQFQLRVEGALT